MCYMIRDNNDKTITISKWEDGKQPIRVYTLKPDPIGRYSCNCMSGYHRRYCKHADMAVNWVKAGRPSPIVEEHYWRGIY